ncbi:hypothetical protein [Phytohabitans houttuyneae]|uniref:ABC transporter n=1 Tax=Phytohabitans houttuyneae TaxID=1076126 RepID=A0A6V8KDK8_9ACTN|nr:hypothetical protein [Phytohabitans houttuyneae]GFJ83312.1 ABC transporter [Phytohabitans houttuyneae]
MSAAAVDTRPAATHAPVPGTPRRAMLALARFEATRLLRHPLVILAALLFIGPWAAGQLTGTGDRHPVLQDADTSPQLVAMLLLGGAAMVAANLAVLRAHRHHADALLDVLVLPDPWRTGGFLLAVLPLGAVAAALAGLRIAVLAAAPAAAGRPSPWELLLYPAVVLLLGAAGVLLARLVRSVIFAPLALLGLAVASFGLLLPTTPGQSWLRWLLPVAAEPEPLRLPVDLMSRPAGRHLAYVCGLAVLAAVSALAASGARSRRLTAVAAAGLSVAVLAGSAQLLPHDAADKARTAAVERPAEFQTCRRLDTVTYCAFPDFTPWIGAWDTVVRGVLRRVPEDLARQPFAVRQRIAGERPWEAGGTTSSREERAALAESWRRADAAAGTPRAVVVGTSWGDGRSEISFAGSVAYEVVTHAGAAADGVVCGARAVLVGWLAGQSTVETTAGLREVDANSSGGVSFGDPRFGTPGMTVPDREMAVVRALLRRPGDQVAATVLASWAELSAATTPTERVGDLFGVAVPPPVPEHERMVCTA